MCDMVWESKVPVFQTQHQAFHIVPNGELLNAEPDPQNIVF